MLLSFNNSEDGPDSLSCCRGPRMLEMYVLQCQVLRLDDLLCLLLKSSLTLETRFKFTNV